MITHQDRAFIALCRKTVKEVTGIDICKKIKNKDQKIVNARLCFIGIFINYEKLFPNISDPELAKIIPIDRSTISYHTRKIIDKSTKIEPIVFKNIDICCKIVEIKRKKDKKPILDLLVEYQEYLKTELITTEKILKSYINE